MFKTSQALVISITALVATACSTEPERLDPPPPPGYLAMQDGSVISGNVVKTSADTVIFQIDGETIPQTISRADLDPLSFYVARTSSPNLTVMNRVELARFNMKHGLFHCAEIEVDQVVIDDPNLAEQLSLEIRESREKYAAELTKQSDRCLADGDIHGAEILAAQVLTEFSDTRAAASAKELVEKVHAEIGDTSHDVTPQLVSSKSGSMTVGNAQKYSSRAKKRNLVALQKSGSGARKSFENSISDNLKALEILNTIIEKKKSDPEDLMRAQTMRKQVLRDSVDVSLNLANFYLSRGSYPQAEEAATKALEIDPTSERARRELDRAVFVSDESARVRKLGRKKGRVSRYSPPQG